MIKGRLLQTIVSVLYKNLAIFQLTIVLLSFQSCKKNEPESENVYWYKKSKPEIIYQTDTISNKDTLNIEWGLGDEMGVILTKEPKHAEYFNLGSKGGYAVFSYKSLYDFTGEDSVELKLLDWNFKTEKMDTFSIIKLTIKVIN